MDCYKSYDYNKEIVKNLCVHTEDILRLFSGDEETNNDIGLNNTSVLILFNDIKFPMDDNIMCNITININEEFDTSVKYIFSLYEKQEDYTSNLFNQINKNLLVLYNWYKYYYNRDIDHKRINKFIASNIHEELKLDLRRRIRPNAN